MHCRRMWYGYLYSVWSLYKIASNSSEVTANDMGKLERIMQLE